MTDVARPGLGAPGAAPGATTLEVTSTPVLSYALAHNRVRVVTRVAITHPAGPVRAATLRVSVRDAEGPIGAPVERLVDLEPGSTTVLTDLGLLLDPAAMLQIEEQRPGRIDVDLVADGLPLARTTVPVQVLAAAQWLATPLSLALEMLAAFVLPNHPAVTALVSEAADELLQRTGSPSVQGYQAGADRVDEIAEALATAVQRRGIRYAEPPASWADVGQKVRTPGEVLDGRVGTCLDTVVVLAAALEQAGIRPLLWLVDGHAFLGYWRAELSAGSAAVTDVAALVNLVDLGLVRLVETTLLTARDEPVPFADTARPPVTGWLTGDLDRVLGVTDVQQARRDGILPLPARTRDADGTVHVVEYRPAVPPVPTRPDAAGAVAPGPPRTGAPPRVLQWKNALLDLSLRNRLINSSPRGEIALTVPDGGLATLEDMVGTGTPITLLAGDDLAAVQRERGLTAGRELPQEQLAQLLADRRAVFTDVPEAGYLTRLRALAHRARTVVEETGANNLYLALGTLVWDLDGRALRSPLVLVPVTLTPVSRQGAYRVTLDESGTSTPNYCLLEKLRQVHGLSVPGLADPADDGAGIDLDAGLQAMRLALAAAGLPFRVEPTAALAVLQFAKFRLWKDLDEHWADFTANPLVQHLTYSPTDPFADPAAAPPDGLDLDELAATCPVPADASQLAAVAEAVAGRTFVLEGPPGTGKSQTITNLLTRLVADGKRVLFVAEKRAALDVVARRLEAVGMGPFALDLHDKGSKPAAVRAQVRAALDHVVSVDEQGMAADTEDLRSARRGLARYAARLHEPNTVGLSLYSARTGQLAAGREVPALPVPATFVAGAGAEHGTAVRRALAQLADVADLARPRPTHPWAFLDSPDVDPGAVVAAATDLDTALTALPTVGPLAGVLAAAQGAGHLAALALLGDGSAPGRAVTDPAAPGTAPPDPAGGEPALLELALLDEVGTDRWARASSALVGEVAAFAADAHPGLDRTTAAALDLPLADLHAAAQGAARSSWFGRKGRLAAVGDRLLPVLRPGVDVPPRAVPELVAALLTVQSAMRGLVSRAAQLPGVHVPPGWNVLRDPALLADRVGWLRAAGTAVRGQAGDPFVAALRAHLAADGPLPDVAGSRSLARAGQAGARLSAAGRLDDGALARWCGTDGLLDRWAATRAERALDQPGTLSLQRWLALLAALEPLRAAGLAEARRVLLAGQVPADDAVRGFERGTAEASIGERREATGLGAFDAEAHERGIRRFTGAASAVRAHLGTAVPAQVIRARPFDAATGVGHVGALQRELAKTRRGLGVRGLLTTYGDLITAVMPCTLVSPDSVSRFFPARAGLFDVVVFDEASQIRVADAIGALGRSRAAVVVGDSRQMPPTSFGEPGPEAEGDAVAAELLEQVEDEESILSECVQARVARQWLSWHYRSQDESLIAFSNAQYYENRLSSFPAPVHGRASPGVDGRGVSLVRVDGHFHRSGTAGLLRTNPVEAAAVVEEIRRRFAASPDVLPSIGVVTFNVQQRATIEGLLRDSGDERLVEALERTDGEGLFVKNLENVQGDERDVVFFSTGFSADARGRLPLNFGPLNRTGGERRLNVAITRARRQVVVYCSFDPEQLHAEETSSVGVRHLRAYLDLAAHGTDALPQDTRAASVLDRHREEIAGRLRARGVVVRTDVGLSEFRIDLAVARPDQPDAPTMAVLLDGPAWARRRTVGDRDGLPGEVLCTLLRWPVVARVWLPTWLSTPEAVLDQLVAALDPPAAPAPAPAEPPAADRAGDEPTGDEPPGAGVRSSTAVLPVPRPHEVPLLPEEEPFLPWTPAVAGERGMLDRLGNAVVARKIGAVVAAGIAAEGPVHRDRLTRLVAGAFGLARVSEARRESLAALVPAGLWAGDFAWPPELDRLSWAGFRRTPSAVDRPLEHVAPEEIGNAMVALCRAGLGMAADELTTQTLEVFGHRRRTPALVAQLDAARQAAVAAGRLTEQPSGLITG